MSHNTCSYTTQIWKCRADGCSQNLLATDQESSAKTRLKSEPFYVPLTVNRIPPLIIIKVPPLAHHSALIHHPLPQLYELVHTYQCHGWDHSSRANEIKKKSQPWPSFQHVRVESPPHLWQEFSLPETPLTSVMTLASAYGRTYWRPTNLNTWIIQNRK